MLKPENYRDSLLETFKGTPLSRGAWSNRKEMENILLGLASENRGGYFSGYRSF